MKRIIIEVQNEHEVEIISQVLHEAVEVDPALDFPYTFTVEDVDEEERKRRFEGGS